MSASPTTARPTQLKVTVTNVSDEPISVGEERAIVFAYVHSETRPGLVLLPASESVSPPRDGCWRLPEPIAIAEYYGVVDLAPGESTERTLGVWGGPELTEGCLPTGEFRFETTFSGGPARDGGIDPPEWTASWGFSLTVE
ncbi:MAG: hypothetical protein R3324_07905 [Halobacteriales archaeon]|nr:hypothetical protein [Halobacteriales archaeon]